MAKRKKDKHRIRNRGGSRPSAQAAAATTNINSATNGRVGSFVTSLLAGILLVLCIVASPWALRHEIKWFATTYVSSKVASLPFDDRAGNAVSSKLDIANYLMAGASTVLILFVGWAVAKKGDVVLSLSRWSERIMFLGSVASLGMSVYSGVYYKNIISGYQLTALKTQHIPDIRHITVEYGMYSQVILLTGGICGVVYVLIEVLWLEKDD